MSDEQIIYLSPEEELTTVRERLEQAQARHIILVIPPQTQMRSHVGWRLLHSRARELDKEVLVISSDRQIRAVVKAAGFRVADSLESPPSSKPHPSSRPSRSNPGKGTARGRNMAARSGSSPRSGGPRSGRSNEGPNKRHFKVNDQLTDLQEEQRRPTRSPESHISNETRSGNSAFDTLDSHYHPDFEFRVETPPAIRPLPVKEEDEEPDLLSNDYQISQRIRKSAQKSQADRGSQQPAPEVRSPRSGSRSLPPDPEETLLLEQDPFRAMEDDYPAPLPDQRGGSAISDDEPGEDRNNRSDYGTEEIVNGEIEDLGDEGDFSAGQGSIPDSWNELIEEDHPIQSSPARRRSKELPGSSKSKSSRKGISMPLPPEPEAELDEDDFNNQVPEEDQHLEFEDQPTRNQPFPEVQRPVERARPSGNLRPGGSQRPVVRRLTPAEGLQRSNSPARRPPSRELRPSGGLKIENEPQTLIMRPAQRDQAGAKSGTRSSPLATTPTGNLAERSQLKQRSGTSGGLQAPAAAARPGTRPGIQQQATKRSQRGQKRPLPVFVIVAISVILLLVICLGFLMMFILPTADVTITIPTRDFTHAIKLAATNGSTNQTTTVATRLLTHDIAVTGQGNATGKTPIGTVKATGFVLFTNNGNKQVVIPTGVIVSTNSGIRFATTADALISTTNSNVGNTITVPIEAQNAGRNGNVDPGTISTIPQEGLDAIAHANGTTASNINLTLTNTSATTGGGTGNATTVTSKDVSNLKTNLDKQVQAQVSSWLHSQLQTGDISAQPVINENPVPTPTQGATTDNGTFTERLDAHIQVMIVRRTDLQLAAAQQLTPLVNTQDPGYVLIQSQSLTFNQLKSTASRDKKSLLISGNATAQIGRQTDAQGIQALLSGKTVDAAHQDLVTHTREAFNTDQVAIVVHPGFFPWLPFNKNNIHVVFKSKAISTGPKA